MYTYIISQTDRHGSDSTDFGRPNTRRKVGSDSDSLSMLPIATYFHYKAADNKNLLCSVSITPQYEVVINYKYIHLETEFLESRREATLFPKPKPRRDCRRSEMK